MTSASLVHEVGHSKLVLCDNPEKWGCGRWEEGSGWGDTCAPMAGSCQCMAKHHHNSKVISLQLKNNNFNYEIKN